MRISLDYYRMLGVSPEATSEQLDRAYQDVSASVPHREFSQSALEERRRLLEKAYSTLTDGESRQDYDQTKEGGLEISSSDVYGALLLLYELGYCAEAIDLAKSLSPEESPEASLLNADRCLVMALAQQSLGLERWQQENYAEAGDYLDQAQEGLMQEGLFLHLRGEIQSYLLKLRPQRILDLLPQTDPDRHQQGIQFLKEMLQERQGIDGGGSDYSGLNTEQFLRFIQKARHYLTTLEQQHLFEEEAKRPSAVASYLTAYALIGRGFVEHRPDLIRRAKGILVKLSISQDVHLERSLCALLLGETEESLTEITYSREYKEITSSYTKDAPPDLLENLCRYCERWLEQEVFPHFADLIGKSPALKDYFADEKVEAYLEELSNASGSTESSSEWVVSALPRPTSPRKVPTFTPSSPSPPPPAIETAMDKHPHPPKRKRSRLPAPLLLAGFICTGLGAGVGAWIWRQQNPQAWPLPWLPTTNPPLVLVQRPLFRAMAEASTLKDLTTLTKERAAQIIQQWQNAKTDALGSTYQIEKLETILIEPSLEEWRSRAEQYKNEGSYLDYTTKGIEVKDLQLAGKDKADVVAIISEDRDFYYRGTKDASASRSGAQYEVTYKLVLRNDTWRIQEMILAE